MVLSNTSQFPITLPLNDLSLSLSLSLKTVTTHTSGVPYLPLCTMAALHRVLRANSPLFVSILCHKCEAHFDIATKESFVLRAIIDRSSWRTNCIALNKQPSLSSTTTKPDSMMPRKDTSSTKARSITSHLAFTLFSSAAVWSVVLVHEKEETT